MVETNTEEVEMTKAELRARLTEAEMSRDTALAGLIVAGDALEKASALERSLAKVTDLHELGKHTEGCLCHVGVAVYALRRALAAWRVSDD